MFFVLFLINELVAADAFKSHQYPLYGIIGTSFRFFQRNPRLNKKKDHKTKHRRLKIHYVGMPLLLIIILFQRHPCARRITTKPTDVCRLFFSFWVTVAVSLEFRLKIRHRFQFCILWRSIGGRIARNKQSVKQLTIAAHLFSWNRHSMRLFLLNKHEWIVF